MTVETKKSRQYIAALAAAGGAFAAGTALGWTNPVERTVKNFAYGFVVSDEEFSWVGSTMNLGAAAVCIPTGCLIQCIGRKNTKLILVAPFLLGWGLLIGAKYVWMLYLGRIFIGIAGGGYCVASPVYIAEIAEKNIRGALGSFFQLMITGGILFVFVIGAFTNAVWTTVVCSVIPMIFLAVFIFMPESPLYLISKSNELKAETAIAWLRGKSYDKSELSELMANKDKFKETKISFKEKMLTRACWRALLIAIMLMVFQQLCGINAVIFYSTEVLGLTTSGLEPRFSTIIIGVVQVVATLFAVLFVDRLGRRLLLLLSATFMAISNLALGIYFCFQERDSKSIDSYNWVPICSLCLFIVMFSFGFGPVPWLMVGELFPTDIKGPVSSIAGTTNWLLAFFVTKTYVDIKEIIGTGETFLVFAFITILGFFFVLLVVPETKGKTLSEVQDTLERKKYADANA